MAKPKWKNKKTIDYILIDTKHANWIQKSEIGGNANPRTRYGHKVVKIKLTPRKQTRLKKKKR